MKLHDKKAFVYLHDSVLLIGSSSGPGACIQDDFECSVVKLSYSTVADREIGNCIRDAWSCCRRIDLMPSKEVIEKHLTIMEAKNIKSLYRNTMSASVLLKDGLIYCGASHQKGIGHFIGIGYKKTLPETATNEEIGAMVRDVLAHCTTKY
jgi:hypothetical protein